MRVPLGEVFDSWERWDGGQVGSESSSGRDSNVTILHTVSQALEHYTQFLIQITVMLFVDAARSAAWVDLQGLALAKHFDCPPA